MKALVKYEKGPGNLELREVPKPTPTVGQVLIKVKYAGICGTDMHIYKDDGGYKFNPPVILGHELSGMIESVGEGVDNSLIGKPVISETFFSTCGTCFHCRSGHRNRCDDRVSIGSGTDGAMAEYVVVPQNCVHILPESISLKEASLAEPFTCVLKAVYEYNQLKASDTVVITGPGPIGLLVLQLVKAIGCKVMILGITKDKDKLDLAKELGADYVAYSNDNDEAMKEITKAFGDLGADYVFECAGVEPAVNLCLRAVRKGGSYTQVALFGRKQNIDFNLVVMKEIEVRGSFSQNSIWWDKAIHVMEEQNIDFDRMITGVYPLEQWQEALDVAISGKGLKVIFDLEA
ncbi:MAG: zinc-binding dehydrogenase [Clostridiales bacterium]|nr:zinc-binding dehydrogenase [Clostridiales bacterium]